MCGAPSTCISIHWLAQQRLLSGLHVHALVSLINVNQIHGKITRTGYSVRKPPSTYLTKRYDPLRRPHVWRGETGNEYEVLVAETLRKHSPIRSQCCCNINVDLDGTRLRGPEVDRTGSG
jgi:hypothetical protein